MEPRIHIMAKAELFVLTQASYLEQRVQVAGVQILAPSVEVVGLELLIPPRAPAPSHEMPPPHKQSRKQAQRLCKDQAALYPICSVQGPWVRPGSIDPCLVLNGPRPGLHSQLDAH